MLIVVKLLLGTAAVHFTLLATAMSRIVWRQVIRRLRGNLLFDAAPDGVHTVFVVEALENSIAADHEEIEVVL